MKPFKDIQNIIFLPIEQYQLTQKHDETKLSVRKRMIHPFVIISFEMLDSFYKYSERNRLFQN
jgi:hypothetical protein